MVLCRDDRARLGCELETNTVRKPEEAVAFSSVFPGVRERVTRMTGRPKGLS